MDILFWLMKDKKVLEIPIPAINIALIDTSDKNCEKLLIIPQPSFLGGLNDQQLEAVTLTDGPLLVLSGAGTGKTKVLISRKIG